MNIYTDKSNKKRKEIKKLKEKSKDVYKSQWLLRMFKRILLISSNWCPMFNFKYTL